MKCPHCGKKIVFPAYKHLHIEVKGYGSEIIMPACPHCYELLVSEKP